MQGRHQEQKNGSTNCFFRALDYCLSALYQKITTLGPQVKTHENMSYKEARTMQIKYEFLRVGNIEGAVSTIMAENLVDNDATWREAWDIVNAKMKAIAEKARTMVNKGLDPETENKIAFNPEAMIAIARSSGCQKSNQEIVTDHKIHFLTTLLKKQYLREEQEQLLKKALTAEYENNKTEYKHYVKGSFKIEIDAPSASAEPLSSYSEERSPSSNETPVEEVNNGLKKMKIN